VIGKAGLSFSVSFDRSEGFLQAIRNLVELSTIEALGKLTRVPYWQCLSIEPTNPTFKAEAREWFDLMGADERDRVVKDGLARAGYYRGGASGAGGSAELSDAIGRYQADNDLVPNGRVDFDLYYRLLASTARASAGGGGRPASAPAVPAVAAASMPPRAVPRLTLTTSRGPRPVYRVNETLSIQVQPSSDGFVYCYYQDSSGAVARIFPNRFQADGFIPAQRMVEIPPGENSFDIRLDTPGTRENVVCLASDLEVGVKLPDEFKTQDLEPMAVRSIDEIAAQFRRIAPSHVDDVRMGIEVVR
jgi:hypothetical protein